MHNDALASFNEQQSKQTAMELERIKSDTQKKNLMIKARIQGKEKKKKNQTKPEKIDIFFVVVQIRIGTAKC